MATTTPKTFTGMTVLTDAKVAEITQTYESALANEDKADHDDALYYEGVRVALQGVLELLHGNIESLMDFCDL